LDLLVSPWGGSNSWVSDSTGGVAADRNAHCEEAVRPDEATR
jgi:hypothetical protein